LIAQSAARPDLYYWLIIVLHVVDIVWFIAALWFSYHPSIQLDKLSVGELLPQADRANMWVFLILDVCTLLAACVIYWLWFHQSPTDKSAVTADYVFLGALVVISAIDLVVLRDYYFSFEKWAETNSVKRQNATS
jgi:magnesium-transporting ATPase (P-type)